MREVKLKEVLTESKIPSESPDPDRRITVKLNVGGVEKRGLMKDSGTTNYYTRQAGQFIYGRQNLFKGAFGVVPQELAGYESSIDLPAFDVSEECIPEWIVYFMHAGERYKHLESLSKGSGSKRIHPRDLLELSIPLPSIEEQKIILEKIHKIEATYKQTSDELQTQSDLIAKLRSSILSDAVSGRLVAQDPADEPAGVLLDRIKAEKEKLVKEGKIKKQKPLPPISEDEIPYELPEGWVWCRLGELCDNITSGSTPPKIHFTDKQEIPYLKVYNIVNQKIAFDYRPQYVKQEIHETKLKRSILKPGDVVMNIVGPPLGKTAIIPETHAEWNCNQAIAVFRPIHKKLNEYIYTYLCEGTFLKQISLIGTAGQDNISITKSNNLLIPLPPLAEQHRIVAKVEKLMTTFDALEAEVQKSRTETDRLMQTVLKEAFFEEEDECTKRKNRTKLCISDVSDGLCSGVKYLPNHEFAQCDWGGGSLQKAYNGFKPLQNHLTCCVSSPREFLLSHYHADHYKGLVQATRSLKKKSFSGLDWEPEMVYLPGMPQITNRNEFYKALLTVNMFTLGDNSGSMEIDLLELVRKMRKTSTPFKYRFLYQGDSFDLAGVNHTVLWPPRFINDVDLDKNINEAINEFNDLKTSNSTLRYLYDQVSNDYSLTKIFEQSYGENSFSSEQYSHGLDADKIPLSNFSHREKPLKIDPKLHNVNEKLRDIANFLSLAFYKENDLLFMGDVSPKTLPKIVQILKNSHHTYFHSIIAPHHGTYWDNSLLALKACNILVSAGSKLSKGLQQQWHKVGKNVLSTHTQGNLLF